MNTLPDFFNSNRFRDWMGLQRQMDKTFDDLWGVPAGATVPGLPGTPAFTPSCDVHESDREYLMSFDLPGVRKENIHIEMSDGVLTVFGERKEEAEQKEKRKYRMERFYGSFSRSFRLPADVRAEQIQAQYADGVLKLTVPKGEVAKARQIKIT